MQQAYPTVPQEVKDRLHLKGFKPYKYEPLPDFVNPHSATYWITNALIFGICWRGRQVALANDSVRLLWSAGCIAVPLFAIMTKARLDHPDDHYGHRKNLTERLEYSPVTRRAWGRALEINTKYQQELKNEIADLERRLGK